MPTFSNLVDYVHNSYLNPDYSSTFDDEDVIYLSLLKQAGHYKLKIKKKFWDDVKISDGYPIVNIVNSPYTGNETTFVILIKCEIDKNIGSISLFEKEINLPNPGENFSIVEKIMVIPYMIEGGVPVTKGVGVVRYADADDLGESDGNGG